MPSTPPPEGRPRSGEEAPPGTRGAVLEAYAAALDAVGGRNAVHRRLRARSFPATHLVAVGKAAVAMTMGALEVLGDNLEAALVITKTGHLEPLPRTRARVRALEAAHPRPDQSSVEAGRALLGFVADAPAHARFLALLSGGASSLVEVLPEGLDAGFLTRVNDWLLASGLPIGAMNRVRKRISRIKAGRLAIALDGREALCLLISDVPADDPRVIGSGLLAPHEEAEIRVEDLDLPQWLREVSERPPPLAPLRAFRRVRNEIVARPADARRAAAAALAAAGFRVVEHPELLEGDAIEVGRRLAEGLVQGPARAEVWASETTVVLPPSPGRGGRCQSLALAAARVLAGRPGVALLAAGTDGTDGPGEDAGALVDGATVARGEAAGLDAAAALAAADAGTFLAASGDLLHTGPTGTNVMDIIVGVREPPRVARGEEDS